MRDRDRRTLPSFGSRWSSWSEQVVHLRSCLGFEPSAQTIRSLIKQADLDQGRDRHHGGMASATGRGKRPIISEDESLRVHRRQFRLGLNSSAGAY